MRIIATCDLHYNIIRSRRPTETVAREICAAGGDLLLLLGDLAGVDLSVLERAFGLFDAFRGTKLFVPGNHELWTEPDGDSMQRYRHALPEICHRNGVHMLDGAPFRAGDVAVVGSVGWYDYTFRLAALGVPLRFYCHKVAPGSASMRPEWRPLLDEAEDVPPAARDIVCRWMDGANVRLGCSDIEFTDFTAARLRDDLESVADARCVVVGLHHVPFHELVPRLERPTSQFAAAFLGSELLGETLQAFPNVRQVYCGHSHAFARCQRGALTATAIGSTYVAKHRETLDL
ncbi:MAG: metallophosphoesterase [Phycisphaerae bacterium]|nr:metallophosphoesterase [Phycisphaerae bacterium]NUQ47820.1 metallophosphoesterase [Phycisphaerae bacterium]